MESAPNSLSTAWLEQHKRRFGQGYAFGPGDFFPIEVENVLFGGGIRLFTPRLRLYVPVLTDDLLTLEVSAAWVLRSLRAFGQNLEKEEDRAEAAKRLLLRQGDATRAVVLFQALGYEIFLNYEIVHRDPARTLVTFLEQDLRLTSFNAQIAVAGRYKTHAFAESLGYEEAFLDARQAENEAAQSVMNSLLIIEREVALFIIGGEVIRGGAWLVQLARDTRGVEAVVRTLLGFAQRHEAAAAVFFMLDELFVAVRFLGGKLLTLLTVVGIHDVLLAVVPLLARLEGMVLGYLEAELTARAQGAATLQGWVVDDDPVDQHFARFLMAQEPEARSNA